MVIKPLNFQRRSKQSKSMHLRSHENMLLVNWPNKLSKLFYTRGSLVLERPKEPRIITINLVKWCSSVVGLCVPFRSFCWSKFNGMCFMWEPKNWQRYRFRSNENRICGWENLVLVEFVWFSLGWNERTKFVVLFVNLFENLIKYFVNRWWIFWLLVVEVFRRIYLWHTVCHFQLPILFWNIKRFRCARIFWRDY